MCEERYIQQDVEGIRQRHQHRQRSRSRSSPINAARKFGHARELRRTQRPTVNEPECFVGQLRLQCHRLLIAISHPFRVGLLFNVLNGHCLERGMFLRDSLSRRGLRSPRPLSNHAAVEVVSVRRGGIRNEGRKLIFELLWARLAWIKFGAGGAKEVDFAFTF